MSDITAAPATSDRRARTREKLMDAAFEVFAEHGFAGASLETLSERAGLTRGAFYYNFSSKEELFLAVIDREFESSMSELSAAATGDVDLTDLYTLVTSINSIRVRDQINWAILIEEFRLHAMRDLETAAAFTERFASIYERLGRAFTSAADVLGLKLLAPAEDLAAIAVGIFLQTVSEGVLAQQSAEQIQQRSSDLVMAILKALMPQA